MVRAPTLAHITIFVIVGLSLNPVAKASLNATGCGDPTFTKITSLAQSASAASILAGPRMPGKRPAPVRTAATYGGVDPREPMNVNSYPASAIGYLMQGGCTVPRISECHVLTTAHCVYTPNGDPRPFTEILYSSTSLELARARQSLEGKSEGPVVWSRFKGNYQGDDPTKIDVNRVVNDLVIGRLPGRPGANTGYFGIQGITRSNVNPTQVSPQILTSRSPPSACEPSSTINVSGYSSDKREPDKDFAPLMNDSTTEVVRSTHNGALVHYRAATFNGSSGGPVWECHDDGVAYLAAINSVAKTTNEPNIADRKQIDLPADEEVELAIGVSVSAHLEEIEKFIAENPCDPEQGPTSDRDSAGTDTGAGAASATSTQPQTSGQLAPKSGTRPRARPR